MIEFENTGYRSVDIDGATVSKKMTSFENQLIDEIERLREQVLELQATIKVKDEAGQFILDIFDHPTRSVSIFDADKLRDAVNLKPSF